MRLSVVAEYHRYDSNWLRRAIQPDQSAKQIIENESIVSTARNSLGL